MGSVTILWGWVLGNVMLVGAHHMGARYSNNWAVEVNGGEQVARELALKHGFQFNGECLRGFYLYSHNSVSKISSEQSHEHHRVLREEPQILWFEQQQFKTRVKREEGPRPWPQMGHLEQYVDPQFQYDLLNRSKHGTMCARGVAEEANHAICAWDAGIEDLTSMLKHRSEAIKKETESI